MRTKICAWIALAGLLAGCATLPHGLFTYRDELSGDLFELTTDNLLYSPQSAGTEVWLNASRVARKNGLILYYLEVHCEAAVSPLQIESGQTLILSINGQQMEFGGLGSVDRRKIAKNGSFIEDAVYLASSGDIRKIAEAKEVKVKIIGKNGVIQRDFQPANFEKFKLFVATYLERQPTL